MPKASRTIKTVAVVSDAVNIFINRTVAARTNKSTVTEYDTVATQTGAIAPYPHIHDLCGIIAVVGDANIKFNDYPATIPCYLETWQDRRALGRADWRQQQLLV